MRVRLQHGYRATRVKARRYREDQRRFLNSYVDKLEEMGFFEDMPTTECQWAPLLVPKPDSDSKHRMTVDERPANAARMRASWPLPHMESEICDFAGSICFAMLDFVSDYWHLPLHPNCEVL